MSTDELNVLAAKTLMALSLAGAVAALVFGAIAVVSAVEVTQSDDGAVFIKLSAEEAQACKAEGGCALVTAVGLQQAILRSCGASIGKSA